MIEYDDNVNLFDKIMKLNDSNVNINCDETPLQLEEIKKLSIIFDNIFKNNETNNFLNKIEFNYNFKEECSVGFIEYKRTLSSYGIGSDKNNKKNNKTNKTNKLIRQIYWRIYEGLLHENINFCYYIIGLEDSGIPSNITQDELEISLEIISNSIKNINLNFTYLYLYNSNLDYNFIIVKFSLDDIEQNLMDYF